MTAVHPALFVKIRARLSVTKRCKRLIFPHLPISLRAAYHLYLPIVGRFAVEVHQIGTKSVTVGFKSHQAAHESHSVVIVLFAKDSSSKAGLTPRTAGLAGELDLQQVHVLAQSGARLQLMRLFQLTERGILTKQNSHMPNYSP